ncbi:DUF3168 domain-containing protein [Pseudomonas putida]|uniref:DUF3168 domain-containing protein n=1 Tax=Pseudomonas putida TaxID=303 RepID=A0A1X0ZTK7_PSEPU|nr:DUF3168 domain-containing protein [Pseudomonas putida]ORL62906.1 hypothetical protein B7H17_16255 [Pseudomonas putida]
MYPPIFPVVAADPAATALLGTDPVRFFPFGMAPQNVAKPYAVWQQVTGGEPYNRLNCRPGGSRFRLQIDAYGTTASQARAVADAIERALELTCHVVSYNGETRDPETLNYRSSFDINWIEPRV